MPDLHPSYPIRTARLLIRPLAAADTEDLLAYRSMEQVCRYVPFYPMDSAAVAEKLKESWARRMIRAEGDSLTLGVELAESGALIGDVVLFFHSSEHRGGEIGWVLNPAYSGFGYATEACHALLHLAFGQLGLHRVVARVVEGNSASLRLADRLGMRREAHLISNRYFKGAWVGEVDFALVEDDWATQHAPGGGLGDRPR